MSFLLKVTFRRRFTSRPFKTLSIISLLGTIWTHFRDSFMPWRPSQNPNWKPSLAKIFEVWRTEFAGHTRLYVVQRGRKANAHGFDLLGILKHRPFGTWGAAAVSLSFPKDTPCILFFYQSVMAAAAAAEQHPSFKIFSPAQRSTNRAFSSILGSELNNNIMMHQKKSKGNCVYNGGARGGGRYFLN